MPHQKRKFPEETSGNVSIVFHALGKMEVLNSTFMCRQVEFCPVVRINFYGL